MCDDVLSPHVTYEQQKRVNQRHGESTQYTLHTELHSTLQNKRCRANEGMLTQWWLTQYFYQLRSDDELIITIAIIHTFQHTLNTRPTRSLSSITLLMASLIRQLPSEILCGWRLGLLKHSLIEIFHQLAEFRIRGRNKIISRRHDLQKTKLWKHTTLQTWTTFPWNTLCTNSENQKISKFAWTKTTDQPVGHQTPTDALTQKKCMPC